MPGTARPHHRPQWRQLPARIRNRLLRLPADLARRHPLDLGASPARTVLVAGSGRSGTTWLAEILLAGRPARFIFEPFHPHRSPESGPLGGRRYVPPRNREPALAAQLERILRGRIHNDWVNRFNHRPAGRRRLIKAIRANLMLRWIRELVPELKIILIIRHPCAMAHSYTELHMRPPMEEYLDQPALVRDYLGPFAEEFRAPSSPFTAHLLRWSLEQAVALDGLDRKMNIHIVFYEHLCVHPHGVLEHLGDYLGWNVNAAMVECLLRPSVMSHADSAVRTGADRVQRWRAGVSPSRIAEARDILIRFGLDGLYGLDGMPAVAVGAPPPAYTFPARPTR